MKSETRDWGAHHPYDRTADCIIKDVQSRDYEDAAFRVKLLASNCKAAGMNKAQFNVIMGVIDKELQQVCTQMQYSLFRTAMAKVTDAPLSTNDKRLTIH